MLRKKISGQKGSMVVEASIVVPIIILAVIAILYICILLYQKAIMQSLADKAAELGAAAWSSGSSDFETGRLRIDELGKVGLYWRIFDLQSENKKSRVWNFVESKLAVKNVFQGFDPEVDIELKDYILYKKLVVTIRRNYPIPLGKLLEVFGFQRYYTVSVRSEAVIKEPVEFIMNTDFILDTERELEAKYPELKDLGDKTRELISNIKGKINDFFK